MISSKLFTEFFESEKAGGLLLIGCTAISLLFANTGLYEAYTQLWHAPVGSKSVEFWINDGLMTLFFLLVGLEIEREIYVGEFKEMRKALLPILAAIGGMVLPAAIHFAFNAGTVYQSGFGVPMATDIAFSLGILSLLGNRVPLWLKLFLTALAIIDDLGAILIIALFYSGQLQWSYLMLAIGLFFLLLICNRARIQWIWVYLLTGMVMWYAFYQTGIHPTITGVLVAFAIPFGDGSRDTVSYKLQHHLHKPVAFLVLPLFALANTGIPLSAESFQAIFNHNSVGIMIGLVVGKPLGILLFSGIGIAAGWCIIPDQGRKRDIIGAGMLAGIGFTMSIFISLLAYDDPEVIIHAKLAVLIASFMSGAMGYAWLKMVLRTRKKETV